MGFRDYAEAQTTAALRALIVGAAEPALTQIDALRADLDVRRESLTATLAGIECIDPALHEVIERLVHAAAEEANAAAQAAPSLALEEARVRLELERSETRKQLELGRTEAAAGREADRRERAALTEALDKAREQTEAIRAHGDAQQGEIEALRAQLEEARAEVQRARAETSRVEQVEESQPVTVEVEAQPQEPAACRAVDEAAHFTRVLDALLDGMGALFPRAAVFVVKATSKRLQGWRSVGFTGVAAITKEFELSLANDSALTRAVNTACVVITGDAPAHDGQPALRPGEPWTVTLPVTTGDHVVAVVHADAGEGTAGSAPAFDREAALEASHLLVRRAGERLAALTTSARAAFGNLMSETPVTPHAIDTATAPSRQAEPRRPVATGRFASQLVSEITRYQQPAVPAGLPDRCLHQRLAGEIEVRRLHDADVPSDAGMALSVFDDALGKMLGNGDLDVRGPSELTAVAEQLLGVQT